MNYNLDITKEKTFSMFIYIIVEFCRIYIVNFIFTSFFHIPLTVCTLFYYYLIKVDIA